MTTVLCLGLFLLVVAVPVAGAESDNGAPVVAERLDGLRSDVAEAGGSAALDFAGLAGVRSAPTAAPLAFSMVGFEVPEGATVWFRTSIDGTTWGDWTGVDVHPEEGPDPDSDERLRDGTEFSHLVWVDEAQHLQTRVAGAAPEDVAVHLLDTKGLGRSVTQRAVDGIAATWRGTPATASAAVAQPQIVTRAGWRADESRRRGTPSIASRVQAGIVHHTADGKSYSQADAPGIVRGIYAYHTGSQGWADIGYNFLIDRFGTVYEGRAGGIDKGVIGAHAGGFNTGTFGVALLGEFTGVKPATAARTALDGLLAWKMDLHHIDATATAVFTSGGSTRYSSGTQVTLNTISGHRDVSATACPGAELYAQLPGIRTNAGRLIGDMFVQPEASARLVTIDGAGRRPEPVTLTTGLKPSGAWELTVLDPDGGVVHRDSGSGDGARSEWQPEAQVGLYTWTFTAAGRTPATGQVAITRDIIDRIGTAPAAPSAAVELSRAAFPEAGSATHAVITRDDVFADAMAGGPLAGTAGPLLLTGGGSIDAAVRAELERVLPAGETVYVLGGPSAINDAVLASLEDRWDVERVSGPERVATAAAVAALVLEQSGQTTVMVARAGPDSAAPWADALAGGAYGAREGIPVVLTYTDELHPAARRAMIGVERTFVLGGASAISGRVAAQLPRMTRIAGEDRTATATAIATRLWGAAAGTNGDTVLIGSGYNADAWQLSLAAAPLAASKNAPLLLTARSSLSPATKAHLQGRRYGSGTSADGLVLGSAAVIDNPVVVELSTLLQ